MLLPVKNIGKYGIISDTPACELPENAWTFLQNVTVRDNVIEKAPGYEKVHSPSFVPYALFPAPIAGQNYWVYLGTAAAKAFFSTLSADITRVSGPYTGTEFDLWNGGMFNGFPYFNNGKDLPQVWGSIDLAQKLVDLPNWPTGTYAKVIRSFKNFMVALNVSEGGVWNPRMLMWSNSAAAGAIPSSWDYTDATLDAGMQVLNEGEDALIDCCQLGDANVVYTETQTWLQSLSGDKLIFNFFKRYNFGLLTQNCAKSFKGIQFAVTQDDIVTHNGSGDPVSVVDSRMRRWIFSNLTSSVFQISFVMKNDRNREMWFCFPYGGGGLINMAAIWNWRDDTWTLRDLPDIRAGCDSLYNPGATNDLCDAGSAGSIDTDTDPFGDTTRTASAEVIMMAPRSTEGIYRYNFEYTEAGIDYVSLVERTGLSLAGYNSDGDLVSDPLVEKLCTAVWPRIEAAAGTQIYVQLGCQENEEAQVSWTTATLFTVGMDEKLDLYKTGRFFAVRFFEIGHVPWKLKGYALDVVPLGML